MTAILLSTYKMSHIKILRPLARRSLSIIPQASQNTSQSRASASCPNSFAFAGCGWMVPFYFGVLDELRASGVLNENSVFAGTSAGSLAALVGCCNIPGSVALEALIELASEPDFLKNIDGGLKKTLLSLLPEDAVDRCNKRLFVTATKLWPNPTLSPHIFSEFTTKDHILEAVSASCFIPIYSSRTQLFTTSTQAASKFLNYYIDGGIFAFMPPIGEVQITTFPRTHWRIAISPQICMPDTAGYSLPQLLYWGLVPAPEIELRAFYAFGKQSTREWLEQHYGASNSSTRNSTVNNQQSSSIQRLLKSLVRLSQPSSADNNSQEDKRQIREQMYAVIEESRRKFPSIKNLLERFRSY